MSSPPVGAPGPVGGFRAVRLSELLRQPVADSRGELLGRLSDVIVRLRGADFPVVTGLVVTVGSRSLFVPIDQVGVLGGQQLRLASARLDLRQFERREGEVLLRADVLGHRLLDVDSARLIRAADLQLAPGRGEWVVSGVASRRRPRPLLGRLAGPAGPGSGSEPQFREWARFEPLIGHTGSALARRPFGRIRRLKPAQIADLLEGASRAEETEILGQVHADPELEADVFEELDEDLATRLLGARTDAEIADVLARMRADDAADAIAELPQRRRQPVLDRLPAGQQAKVRTLLGYHPSSAGGLMGVDFVTVGAGAVVADAVAAVAAAGALQPEALTSVYLVDERSRLAGVARLVALVQADPATPLADVADSDPVRVLADTDVVDVAVLMSDYNLVTIPVVDRRQRMLGVITVDDVLEVTLPADWRRREAAEPPDARGGQDT
ncbi:MAG TPA: CBS domain-containing protein [Streptosporangiaceae bacterium]|nr:CBS domain-containing protein [Streptosporangiaceae bacterium]